MDHAEMMKKVFPFYTGPLVHDNSNNTIKSELSSTANTPAAMSDDNQPTVAGQLDLAHADEEMLMRVPAWLWESWAKLLNDDSIGMDEEIQLGMVRIEDLDVAPNEKSKQKVTMRLNQELEVHNKLPKEYDLTISDKKTNNLYVFSEKDAPVIKEKDEDKSDDESDNKDLTLATGARSEGMTKTQKRNKKRREQAKFRKAAAKQTALTGIIVHEVNCCPVDSPEYTRLMKERTAEAMKPKRQTTMLDNSLGPGAGFLATGTMSTDGYFRDFIRTGQPTRAKAQDQKAARMPQNELIDLIYDCFGRYNYWSLKSLKAEVNQPEAYLKSTLEKVADLVKSGPHAMTWTLKPEARRDRYADAVGNEEQAPDAPFGTDGAGDEDAGELQSDLDEEDEDTKMEE
ncbi:MAG: hypothetical protein M1823_001912 [Watsoniomyces obsoletus]|nr:MAG: hypothetical protein M1823_001912 [Watsoniomyces obsoletus]